MTVPIYLVVAYVVFWAFSFALIISMWLRQRRIDQQIALLKDQLGEK
ncbi:MAG: hypothetical protein JXD18_08770 [Anaerolineae bacterium]|nr:hypothetical protein [Anaerolineae bacterium]